MFDLCFFVRKIEIEDCFYLKCAKKRVDNFDEFLEATNVENLRRFSQN